MNLHHLVNSFEIYEFDAVLHQRYAPPKQVKQTRVIYRTFQRHVPDEPLDVAECSCDVIIATVYIVPACESVS